MSNRDFRIEKDSLGEVSVPAQAYYGVQTQRAVDNFRRYAPPAMAGVYLVHRARQARGRGSEPGSGALQGP